MAAISKDSVIINIESLEEITKQECPICYEELNPSTTTKLNPCAHLLCKTCENTLKKSSDILRCPLCRTLIEEPEETQEPRKYSVCEWIEFVFEIIFAIFCWLFFFGIFCGSIYGIVIGGIPRCIGAAILITFLIGHVSFVA